MEKVGQSKNRNQKYFENFNREIIIKNIVKKEDPMNGWTDWVDTIYKKDI